MRVAIFGSQASGKTTTADLLVERVGGVRLSFAQALREEIARSLATPDYPEERILQEMSDSIYKRKWRNVMQIWGTEFRRHLFGKDYWVRKLEEKIIALPEDSNIFIDDLRYNNEKEMLQRHGFVLVKTFQDSGIEQGMPEHASEVEWRSWRPDVRARWQDKDERVTAILEALRTL